MSGAAAVTLPPAFPLSALVGQSELVEALLVCAVSPAVGGVVVRGERGTAKSTAVRGLAVLMPGGGAPLVEVPLGATLDRLLGSLDLGAALAGEARHESGLLVRADGGILYVDEVNLLPDHLVDALLDAAATGVVRVEREAVSAAFAARFVLVGTMNAEEGELRPQLLDRFGLGVEVRTPTDPAQRAEIVRRRLAFEADPTGFAARWSEAETALAARLADARARLPAVVLPERELGRITRACAELGVDGVRGDIVTARAACALAALDGVSEVDAEHVRRAAVLALGHRRRRDPLDPTPPDSGDVERALGEGDGAGGAGERSSAGPADDGRDRPPGRQAKSQTFSPPGVAEPGSGAGAGAGSDSGLRDSAGPSGETAQPPAEAPAGRRVDRAQAAALPTRTLRLIGAGRGPAGRRARGRGPQTGAIDTRPASPHDDDLAVVASLLARLREGDGAAPRRHVRAGRESALLCLVVDASGSMGARRRAARVKGALLELLRDAHARRDRVAVIAFRDARAELVLPPGAPLERAAEALRALPTGGRTPLADGLRTAVRVIRREAAREPDRRAIAVVLTDGRVADPERAIAGAATALGRAAATVAVVDTEDGPVRVGACAEIAALAGGTVHPLIPLRRVA